MRPFLTMLLALVVATSAFAQTEENPLLSALARVPDIPNARNEITYYSHQAVTEAYPFAALPTDAAQFGQILEGNAGPFGFGGTVWFSIYRNNATDPLSYSILYAEEFPASIGVDFFDITAALEFGQPPGHGLILHGDFDTEAVGATLTASGFTETPDTADLWCSAAGCDAGNQTNLERINRGNPFGGHLGREQPTVVRADTLMSTTGMGVIRAYLNAPTLASRPEYTAAAEVAASYGPIIQAYFIGSDTLNSIGGASDDNPNALPAYDLLALADTATENEHLALVLLTYPDGDTAETAAEALQERLATYTSFVNQQPLSDLLDQYLIDAPTITVVETDQRSVVVIGLSTPKANAQQIINQAEEVVPPGTAYRLLYEAIIMEDAGWLATDATTADNE